MIKKELDALKYELYKKSWKSDYITYNQFVEQQNVAYTFWELQNKNKKKKHQNWLDFNKQKNIK
jgi:hypothetical protein